MRLTGIMASGMIVLGAQVKRLNWGCISSAVEIDLLIRGSTSAWVTFTGIGKEAKKRHSETVLKRCLLGNKKTDTEAESMFLAIASFRRCQVNKAGIYLSRDLGYNKPRAMYRGESWHVT